jgi:mannose-6-phosphate isomerase-like protein (cupin superfamily)
MNDYAVKRIDDMDSMYRGAMKRVRAELGVESFGIQIVDMPPNFENYPAHNHEHDGQEEVYVAMRGGGEIEVDGERFPLDSDNIARVGAGASRKVWPGPEGIRMAIVGGMPGRVYEIAEFTNVGAPDPMESL